MALMGEWPASRNNCFDYETETKDKNTTENVLSWFMFSIGGVCVCVWRRQRWRKYVADSGLAPAVNLPQSQMAAPWSLDCDGLALSAGGNPCLWTQEAGKEKAGARAKKVIVSRVCRRRGLGIQGWRLVWRAVIILWLCTPLQEHAGGA